MRNLLLQSGGLDVTVPSTTTGQKFAALTLIIVLVAGLAVVKWRQKLWGLSEDEKKTRESVVGQRLRKTPAMVQVKSEKVASGTVDLYWQLMELFETSDPQETHTTVRGAIGTAFRAVSIAWAGRVESVPSLARRALGVAVAVAVLGAMAVSTSTVIALLSKSPSDPTLADVISQLVAGVNLFIDLGHAYPYAGVLWSLLFAYTILFAEMVYTHWYAVAGLLVATSISIIFFDRRVDETPPPIIKYPTISVAVTLGSLFLVWAVGAGIAAAGSAVGFPGVGDLIGFLLSSAVAAWILYKTVPLFVGRLRHDIENLRDDSRLTAMYLVTQRVAAALGIVGAVLIGLYMLVGFADGRFVKVAEAFVEADIEIQATVGLTVLATLGAAAYAVAESWTDVRSSLHAAFAQKAVRAQIAKRAIPGVMVIGAYAFLYAMTESIVMSFGLALIMGGLASKGIAFATQASYRADWRSIYRRLARPSPTYVGYLAYELDVDGREYYLIEVNGKQLVSDDLDEVVSAAVDIGTALATNEKPPSTDEEWQAQYLLESGISDPEDWEEKHIEKIRESVFDHLRSNGPRVTRSSFDSELEDFSDHRTQEALSHRSIRPYINLDSEYVSLSTDPYASEDGFEWPSFEQSSRV